MTQTTDAALVERMKRLVAPKDWPEVEGLLTAMDQGEWWMGMGVVLFAVARSIDRWA